MPKQSRIVNIWLTGLFSHRSGRLIASALGVAISVAMLFSLGIFITTSATAMTKRAIESLPIDWQVQLLPGTDPGSILSAAQQAAPVSASEIVGYADVSGMSATTQGTVQTTGAGKIIGLSPSYINQFPAEFRSLLGAQSGVLVAQQTAANLHVTVGDKVSFQRIGLPPVDMTVDGVVDLPYADSFFQAVGVPANIAPQAPPDNVIFLPIDQWHALFDPQSINRPDTTRLQLHIRLARSLPSDPSAAFIQAQRWTRNLEARIAGNGIVADNLAARLDGVRTDSLYARILFLFLGLPGVLLAGILTMAIASMGKDHRRQEQALLRVRGATTSQIIRLAAQEGFLMGVIGGILGIGLGWFVIRWIASISLVGMNVILLVAIMAAVFGLLLALTASVQPAWALAHQTTVAAARQNVGRYQQPLWQRLYLDVICLVLAGIMFWRTAGIGYELVLAPEGVAQVSLSSEAFITPLCLWVGSALLIMRLGQLFLARGKRPFARLAHPLTGNLSGVVFAAMNRQRLRLAQGMALVALAVTFAVSTAIFNTTYDAQARVDAELTNGADVLVQGTSAAPAGDKLAEFKVLPGVVNAEPMQHRFAYVGTDLQDIYGIDPARIGQATHLANTYFANRNAQATLADLASHPDGVLVSEETKNDYQLVVGDRLNLRIQNAADHQYHVVPFTFVGVVREFPTAPKDSFLVANSSYLAQQTGSNAAEIVLLKTTANPVPISQQVQTMVASMPGVKVTDIGAAEKVIGSSLTAINLRGLTALELAFSVLLVASASGLILTLGFEERKKMFTSLIVVGAKSKQLGAFVWSEGLTVLCIGLITGLSSGVALAGLLVLMLTHIFDPPPDVLQVPWVYIVLLLLAMILSTVIAVSHAIRTAKQAGVSELRAL